MGIYKNGTVRIGSVQVVATQNSNIYWQAQVFPGIRGHGYYSESLSYIAYDQHPIYIGRVKRWPQTGLIRSG